MSIEGDKIVDLEGPEASRYWRVVSDHAADHPDARAAAIHARATGSVGCTHNGVEVKRADQPLTFAEELEELAKEAEQE